MKTKIALTLLATGVVGIGIAWATGQFASDPEFEEAQEIQQKLQESVVNDFQKPAAEKDEASHKERRELFEELREKTESLEPEQQSVIRSQMRDFFMAQMEQRIDEFFELPAEEKTAALDEHIDRMESFRAEREEARQQRAAEQQAAGNGEGSGGEASGDRADASRDGDGDVATGGQARGKGRGQRRGPPWRGGNQEERDQWRRQMLDNTTPETRAKFHEFRRLINERREERGLPASRRP